MLYDSFYMLYSIYYIYMRMSPTDPNISYRESTS